METLILITVTVAPYAAIAWAQISEDRAWRKFWDEERGKGRR
jgi:hypothetical protein